MKEEEEEIRNFFILFFARLFHSLQLCVQSVFIHFPLLSVPFFINFFFFFSSFSSLSPQHLFLLFSLFIIVCRPFFLLCSWIIWKILDQKKYDELFCCRLCNADKCDNKIKENSNTFDEHFKWKIIISIIYSLSVECKNKWKTRKIDKIHELNF